MTTNTQRRSNGKVSHQLNLFPGDGSEADWSAVDGRIIRDAIAAAAKTGGALRFGYTRDGGAYALGIYGDGDPYTVYVRPTEDLDGALASITRAFEDLFFTQTPAQSPKKKD